MVVAFALDALTVPHLCAVAAVQSAGSILYLSAAGALIKQLVPGDRLLVANARMETTNWTTATLGPSLGGFLIAGLGAVATLLVDALSYVVGALCLRRMPVAPQPPPPPAAEPTPAPEPLAARIRAGIAHILGHPGLRGLYLNAMLVGGAVTMTAPLLTVFMLRDLRLTAWQYGLVLGPPPRPASSARCCPPD
ncbi:MFS transporter [Asanoa sp. WMMD1127]|uniref:MFS transporter n=1 Tax=Asanoa sp. WMMD1127 TaxID=3016107 RepID=UPI002417618A|nr:MFS transporter [Asanoa sp. WMMD1127]MDG4827370.1 MFS transporter [Asanoa sp. WMMD1127]